MARSLVQLDAYDILGIGPLTWLARHTGTPVEHLVKPSPIQALAAIALAASGRLLPSLEAAYALHTGQTLQPPLAALDGTAVHVFEDAASGLAAAQRAIEALTDAGLRVRLRPYGISPAPGPKRSALQTLGVTTYPSINEALTTALDSIPG